ncbi:MAG TPA: hypothetical protein VGO61_03425 [Steroidobacteraceae bacterium]|jgi:hypothetical protein|nr:hypothetical protein [Steroidobacteraceae bacterium]
MTDIVCTRATLNCEARRAWEKVCFYEHIELPPSWLLRTVLPVPERTSGAYRKVGDVSRCQYSDGGYLTKRIRNLESGSCIEFDVIEQSIRYASHISLLGGTIRIEPREDGSCSVEMVTRYELRVPWLRWIRRPIEYVVGAMHRIVLRDMQVKLSSRPTLDRQSPDRVYFKSL